MSQAIIAIDAKLRSRLVGRYQLNAGVLSSLFVIVMGT